MRWERSLCFQDWRVIERGSDTEARAILHVGIDHCCAQVFVAEEFLHGADIAALFEEVCGERMPEGVAGGGFSDSCRSEGTFECALQRRFIDVVASDDCSNGIDRELGGGEQVLPAKFS